MFCTTQKENMNMILMLDVCICKCMYLYVCVRTIRHVLAGIVKGSYYSITLGAVTFVVARVTFCYIF